MVLMVHHCFIRAYMATLVRAFTQSLRILSSHRRLCPLLLAELAHAPGVVFLRYHLVFDRFQFSNVIL
jgi:hypothetical protein